MRSGQTTGDSKVVGRSRPSAPQPQPVILDVSLGIACSGRLGGTVDQGISGNLDWRFETAADAGSIPAFAGVVSRLDALGNRS